MKIFRSYGNYHSEERQRLEFWFSKLDPAIKRMIIMRINFIAVFVLLTISNLFAGVNAQEVTLSVKNASVKDVFSQIKKQTGYQFFYNNSDLLGAIPVTASLKKAKLKDALDHCLKGQPFSYEIVDQTIVIKRKPAGFIERITNFIKGIKITGNVRDEMGNKLTGVTVRVKGTKATAVTDNKGSFSIEVPDEKAILQFSFIGFKTIEISIAPNEPVNVVLQMGVSQLEEVGVISTGYQSLPKERATGSFETIDNKVLNRRIGSNVMDRIENVVPGILFDRTTGTPEPLTIRGRSTIMAESAPLIVVDNFPFDGSITDINPNDVANVTILKDAAAASIWGARAGNGVIVITTKKGTSPKPKIEVISNLTFQPKPNFSNLRNISSSDYIDLEKFLFSKGYYTADELSQSHNALSPVVELLIAKRDNKIDPIAADAQIEALKSINSSGEVEKYLYKNAISQQYQVNISGKSQFVNYYFSSGLDREPGTLVGNNKNDRLNIRSTTAFQLTPKLSAEIGINYVKNNIEGGRNPGANLNNGSIRALIPYARLVDEHGVSLPIVQNYRTQFMQESMQKGLMNWFYNPVEDISATNFKEDSKNFMLKSNIRYQILPTLNAEVIYQYQDITKANESYSTEASYFVRDLVNRFTQLNTENGQLTRPIPKGDIRVLNNTLSKSHQGRAQINYNQQFGKHQVNGLGGLEVRELRSIGNTAQYYGYNPLSGTFYQNMDFSSLYRQFQNPNAQAAIPNQQSILANKIDHFWSYFANASYSYDNKYLLSASARTDASNLFGVKTNQKGVPLWSVGLAWQIDKEQFYQLNWLQQLKLRTTYGVQGNFSRATSALTTAAYNSSRTGFNYATIMNPPNESLRWEKVKMLNLGLDFTLKGNRVSGSIEYFNKKSSDLMATAPIDATVGLANEGAESYFLGNIANMAGHGFDLRLVSQNINSQLQWSTTALFSYARINVSKYHMPVSAIGMGYVIGGLTNPIVGRPMFSMNSFRWAGLDPQTGDPRGYLSGEVSNDLPKIVSTTSLSDMVYSGNRTPNYFGSLRNDFSYRSFFLSFNISYKAGYYFRRSSVSYNSLFSRWNGSADYAQRWQKPGDEAKTNVPSLVYPVNTSRDTFYTYSEGLVEKGDHIRLEDISLGYDLGKGRIPQLPFQNARLFLYANNLGVLWSANKMDLDPNFLDVPSLRKTISIGLNVTF